jgi:hypothetical protein
MSAYFNPGARQIRKNLFFARPLIRRLLANYTLTGDPAALVIDQNDSEGRKIAEMIDDLDSVRAAIAESQRLGSVPTTVVVSSTTTVANYIRRFAGYSADKIATEKPPEGSLWVASVALGSTILFPLPFQDIDSAPDDPQTAKANVRQFKL